MACMAPQHFTFRFHCFLRSLIFHTATSILTEIYKTLTYFVLFIITLTVICRIIIYIECKYLFIVFVYLSQRPYLFRIAR